MNCGTRHLLLALLVVQLISLHGASAGFDFFKKKDKQQPAGEVAQGETTPAPAKVEGKQQSQGRAGGKQAAVTLAEADEPQMVLPKRLVFAAKKRDDTQPAGSNSGARDHRRNRRREAEKAATLAAAAKEDDAFEDYEEEDYDHEHGHDDDDEGDDDRDDYGRGAFDEDEDADGPRKQLDSFSKEQRDPTKFVSTKPKELPRPNLKYLSLEAKKRPSAKSELINGEIKRNKLITGSYWQKKLGAAYKVTKKGFKESANFISEIPKHMERGMDSINAFLQLDSRGRVLALIDEAVGDAQFVRKEFSQFTLSWSPIMEKALNYLGDHELDRVRLNEKDELDNTRDALHSLAFGYEFMRLMIVWRENLLVAHEAFKVWLEAVKAEVEQKRLEIDESLVVQLRTTHTYMLLTSWTALETEAHEARAKLDYLMELEDDRPKNYESEYFRNIVVLQEMYEPTVEELEQERSQVVNSISESGVAVDNLSDVDEFFESFRNSLAQHEIQSVDWEVPSELQDFMKRLEPQLRRNLKVYSKSLLNELIPQS